MSQNIVYKTYEINTDVEHYAKPINLSGASTVKLTDLPAGVKCWISTESTGENKFPLINRGDGWVNLPAPLYDLYIYTEGTTIDNQKILINYTGQNDFFTYGNNSSEIISKIGEISSLSTQAIKDVNDAIYNTYMKKVVARFLIQGTWSLTKTTMWGRLCYLPLGTNGRIKDLNLSNQKYYRITTQGHFDLGNGLILNTGGDGGEASQFNIPCFSVTAHFSIFKNTGGATYTKLKSVASGAQGLYFDFEPLYGINKSAWARSKDEFNLWGVKHKESLSCGVWGKGGTGQIPIGVMSTIPNGVLNLGADNIMLAGSVINSYDNFGLFWTILNQYSNTDTSTVNSVNVNATPNCHASLVIEVSEVLSA